jgi:hypothetical protein
LFWDLLCSFFGGVQESKFRKMVGLTPWGDNKHKAKARQRIKGILFAFGLCLVLVLADALPFLNTPTLDGGFN